MTDTTAANHKPVLFVNGKGHSLESMSPEAPAQFNSLSKKDTHFSC